MRLHDAVYRIVIVACNSSIMVGENRSDMFSQLRAQRLYVEGERESDINQRQQQNVEQ